MPDLWMPGATRLDGGDHAPLDGGPAKAIAHITWDRNASRSKPAPLVPYTSLVDWFGRNPDGKRAAPHLLWNPWTGQVTQFLPANSRSKSLADQAGGTRTNRAGSVVIQIEARFFPWCVGPDGHTYERLADTPCKGWAEINAWVRSHGVPDVWPMGRPTDFTPRRDDATWRARGGWYAHAHVPENDHQDPGSWPAFATPGTAPDPTPAKKGKLMLVPYTFPAGETTIPIEPPGAGIFKDSGAVIFGATTAGRENADVHIDVHTYDRGWFRWMDLGLRAADAKWERALPAGTNKIRVATDRPVSAYVACKEA